MNTILFIPLFLLTFSSSIAQIQIGQDIPGLIEDDGTGGSVSASGNGQRIVLSSNSAVSIFELSNGNWQLVGQEIIFPGGRIVSISRDGKRVVVGNPYYHFPYGYGRTKVFEEINGTWVQIGQEIFGEEVDDLSGSSVALSANGTRIAIGAIHNDGNGYESGHVRIFEEVNQTWIQVGQDIDGEAVSDWSGESVSISDDGARVAIGAHKNKANSSFSGQVRIYEETNGNWSQIGQDIDGGNLYDELGKSVSISADGRRVASGGPEHGSTGNWFGVVKVHEEINGNWIQVGQDIIGAHREAVGESVSISECGKVLAIGGVGYNGLVRIFQEINGDWIHIGQDLLGDAYQDYFGYSVSLAGNGSKLVVGAPRNDGLASETGLVRVYDLASIVTNTEDETDEQPEITIHPNPTQGQFFIDLQRNYQHVSLTLTDITGRVMATQQVENVDIIPLEIEGGAGVYMLELEIENKYGEVFKVVKY